MDISTTQLVEAAGQFRNQPNPRIFLNNIPEEKRTAAIKSYGKDMGSDETMIVLLDDSAFGSAKSGFFVTDKALYQSLDKKRGRIALTNIEAIDVKLGRLGKGLIINGEKIGDLTQGTQAEYVNLLWFFEIITGKPSEANQELMGKYRAKKDAEEAKMEEEAKVNPRLKEIRQQIADLGRIDSFGTRKEIKYLPDIMAPDEKIMALTSGLMNFNTWLVTCTDRRVIFLNKGMLYGLEQVETPLDKINSITQKTGLIFGEIVIWDGASKMKIENVDKSTVKGFVETVNSAIRKSKQPVASTPAQSASVDVASQLEKLAGLKEKGVLTQEEFDQQKKKLLAM